MSTFVVVLGDRMVKRCIGEIVNIIGFGNNLAL
jgi:hypothetical protein